MFISFPSVNVKVEGIEQIAIPKMLRVHQSFDARHLADPYLHTREQLEELPLPDITGKRICITAGSRGIPKMPLLYRAVVDFLKDRGAKPFVIPAMGSHGNACAEGQLEVLASYGLTEESLGCPIHSSMEVVQYGTLSNGFPLCCDKFAAEADGILLMHKVKPHTDFRGEHESGLCKMIAIGIAKHKGASAFHELGFEKFAQTLPKCAEIFLENFPVLCGVGIVQNAYDEVCTVAAAMPEEILQLDAKLLVEAKAKMPCFKFKDIDLLIIDEIGKEISGFGADPNVTGRTNGIRKDFENILRLNKLFIKGLSETTHHNGCGIAQADITTRRCLESIDWSATWTNLITAGGIGGASIPLYTDTDRDAIQLAIKCCPGADLSRIRIARIKNTLSLSDIQISEALFDEIKDIDGIEAVSAPAPMKFDGEGFLLPFGE